jgi:hypothetical protein
MITGIKISLVFSGLLLANYLGGQCTSSSFSLVYNSGNTCCESCTFTSASPPCYSNQCNGFQGTWWQAGGGECTAENFNISLESSTSHCAEGSNGVELIVLLGFEGQPTNHASSWMRTKIYCGDNPPPHANTELVFDQTEDQFDTLPNNSNITYTYYAECASPNKLHVEQIVYTASHSNRLKISENPNSTCLNCGTFNFLPITIHNEALHHQSHTVHYTFDMKDTELEVASVALGRSTDGATFVPVAYSDPIPTGSQYTRYRLVDENPKLPAYYRAELTTHNGDIKYGKVLLAESGQAPNPLIYPNPVQRGSNLVVEYAGDFSEGHLTDMYGRTSYSFPLTAGANGQVAIPVPALLPAGVYVLQLNNPSQAATYRVVISE